MRRLLISVINLILVLNLVACKNQKIIYTKRQFIRDFDDYFSLNLIESKLIDNNYLDNKIKKEDILYASVNFITFPNLISVDEIIDKALEFSLLEENEEYNSNNIYILFKKIKDLKDYQKIKNHFEIEYQENIEEVDFDFIKNNKFEKDCIDNKIYKYLENGIYKYQKIKKDNNYCALVNPEFEDIISDINLSGEMDINFLDSEISEKQEFEELSYNDNLLEKINNNLGKITKLGNFEIAYNITKNKIGLSLMNNSKNGIFYSNLDIYDVKPSYKFNFKEKYSYFKLAFKTSENIGFKKEYTKNFFKDFKNDNIDEFLNKVLNQFNSKKEIIEKSIPLLDIKTPILGTLFFTFDFNISLDIYVGGKVEINFNTKHLLGYETINGNLRLINDFDKNLDYIINASGELSLGLATGISGLNFKLADFKVNFGIKAKMDNKIYLIKNDDYKIVDSELPSDYLNVAISDKRQLKLCTEFSLYWVFKIKLNSEKTLMSKFGFDKSFDLLNDDFQILKNKIYLQNFQIVDNCYIDFKKENNEKITIPNKERITLFSYYKALEVNQKYTIKFRSLPNGYKQDDFIYTIENDEIASINQSGEVIGKKPGSTIIIIKSKDEKHQISISLLVKNNVNNN